MMMEKKLVARDDDIIPMHVMQQTKAIFCAPLAFLMKTHTNTVDLIAKKI